MLKLDIEKRLQGIKPRILLTPEETSQIIFNGGRSASSLRRDANMHVLPCIKFGRRIYFDAETLQDFIVKRSLNSVNIPQKKNKPATQTISANVPGISTINI